MRARPNKRLNCRALTHGEELRFSPASVFVCRSTTLRQRALRPQLKRDPLGITHAILAMKASVFAVILLVASASSLAAQRLTSPGAVATVAQLYRDFAWEAVVEDPEWHGHGLIDQPRAILRRYFDERLTDLWLADRACASRSRGICRLDFLPMWASQDPAATELKVLPTQDSRVVVVRFRYPSSRDSVELRYQLVKTKSGWRIDDVSQGSRWSLKALLSGKD